MECKCELETGQFTLLERNKLALQQELEAKDERHLLISPEKHKNTMYGDLLIILLKGKFYQATNATLPKLALNSALPSIAFPRRGKACPRTTVPLPEYVLMISKYTALFILFLFAEISLQLLNAHI